MTILKIFFPMKMRKKKSWRNVLKKIETLPENHLSVRHFWAMQARAAGHTVLRGGDGGCEEGGDGSASRPASVEDPWWWCVSRGLTL